MGVQVELRGYVGLVQLDEPRTHHALSRSLVRGVLEALQGDVIAQARAIVISSTGPAFCAGANITDLLDGWMSTPDTADDPVRMFQALAEDPRPTVAAVDGMAIGGGFELMLSCDLAVAARHAWFSLPELSHGVIPNTALMRLQQMIGLRGLNGLMMTAQRLEAERALALGLVNSVCEPGQAIDVAVSLANDIVERVSPGALAVAKRVARHYNQTDWEQVRQSLAQVPSEQWQEGLKAFTDKRKPDYDRFWSDQSSRDPGEH